MVFWKLLNTNIRFLSGTSDICYATHTPYWLTRKDCAIESIEGLLLNAPPYVSFCVPTLKCSLFRSVKIKGTLFYRTKYAACKTRGICTLKTVS
uniref:Uncharacterized protein n=1 Tax=Ixodes ricinus TaxID=34613 RepID=A0A6B0UHH2_IXORI